MAPSSSTVKVYSQKWENAVQTWYGDVKWSSFETVNSAELGRKRGQTGGPWTIRPGTWITVRCSAKKEFEFAYVCAIRTSERMTYLCISWAYDIKTAGNHTEASPKRWFKGRGLDPDDLVVSDHFQIIDLTMVNEWLEGNDEEDDDGVIRDVCDTIQQKKRKGDNRVDVISLCSTMFIKVHSGGRQGELSEGRVMVLRSPQPQPIAAPPSNQPAANPSSRRPTAAHSPGKATAASSSRQAPATRATTRFTAVAKKSAPISSQKKVAAGRVAKGNSQKASAAKGKSTRGTVASKASEVAKKKHTRK